jgi:hypothetical protein
MGRVPLWLNMQLQLALLLQPVLHQVRHAAAAAGTPRSVPPVFTVVHGCTPSLLAHLPNIMLANAQ